MLKKNTRRKTQQDCTTLPPPTLCYFISHSHLNFILLLQDICFSCFMAKRVFFSLLSLFVSFTLSEKLVQCLYELYFSVPYCVKGVLRGRYLLENGLNPLWDYIIGYNIKIIIFKYTLIQNITFYFELHLCNMLLKYQCISVVKFIDCVTINITGCIFFNVFISLCLQVHLTEPDYQKWPTGCLHSMFSSNPVNLFLPIERTGCFDSSASNHFLHPIKLHKCELC